MGGGTGVFQGQQLPEAAPPDSSMWPCEWGGGRGRSSLAPYLVPFTRGVLPSSPRVWTFLPEP